MIEFFSSSFLFLLAVGIMAFIALRRANQALRENKILREQLEDLRRQSSPPLAHAALPAATMVTPAAPALDLGARVSPPAEDQATPPAEAPSTPEQPALPPLPPAAQPATESLAGEDTRAPSGPDAAEPPSPAKPKISLEEALGARAFVWIGAVALALTAVYGVKYSVDHNLTPPWLRVLATVLFGAGLIGAAEWMRRKNTRIGQALSGAGVLALYGAVLASVRLYHLMPSAAGFACMAGVTAGAVMLALRHGAPSAVLGLLGGMAMPVLLSDGGGHTGPLVAYLLILQLGVIGVARKRNWAWLPTLTLVGSLVWQVLLAFGADDPAARAIAAALSLGSAATMVACAAKGEEGRPGPLRLALTACGAALGLLGILAHRGAHDPLSLGLLGAASIGLMVLAWRDARYRGLLPVAAGAGLITVGAWIWGTPMASLEKLRESSGPAMLWASGLLALLWGIGGLLLARARPALRTIAVVLGILVPVVAFLTAFARGDLMCQSGSPMAAAQEQLSSWGNTHIFWGDWGQVKQLGAALPTILHPIWAAVTLALSLFFTTCAFLIAGRDGQRRRATQAYVAAAAAMACLAALLALRHPWDGTAWLGLAALCALTGLRSSLPILPVVSALATCGSALLLALQGEWHLPEPFAPLIGAALAGWGLPALLAAGVAWLMTFGRTRAGTEIRDAAERAPSAAASFAPDLAALAAAGMAVAAVLFGIHHPWEATGWAILAVLAALAALRVALPILPILCAGLGVFVCGALVLRGAWGSALSMPMLMLAYALPAGLLALSAFVQSRSPAQTTTRFTAALTTLTLSAGLTFFTLQSTQGLDLRLPDLGTWVLLVGGQVALALVLRQVGKRLLKGGALAAHPCGVGIYAAVLWTLGCLLLANPTWSRQPLGDWPVLDWLLPAYGLPALFLLWAYDRPWMPKKRGFVAGILGSLLAFFFVSMEVRHLCHAQDIRLSVDFTQGEHYALSVAWALLGAALLAAGILLKRPLPRHGAVAVLLLASAKGFLYDARHLEGLLRVGTFLGLGLTLIGLGFVWQKWVFGKKS